MREIQARNENAALADIYRYAGGSSWHRNRNWNNSKIPPAMWESVGALAQGGGRFVAELWLSRNNLQGSLPFESTWVALTNLTVLECANNPGLGGKLPKLGQLPRLVVLDLTNCQIKGELPDEWPKNLQRLLLNNNHISGEIPRWDLPHLRRLGLSNNRLVGLKTPAHAPGSAADSHAAAGVRAATLKDKLKMAGKAMKTLNMLKVSGVVWCGRFQIR